MTINPATCAIATLVDALQEGSRTRDRTERAAIQILTTVGAAPLAGYLVGNIEVRQSVFQHPVTRAWLIDWQALAARRYEMLLVSSGERVCVDIACALGADTPVRFLGSSIARVADETRSKILAALTVAFGGDEPEGPTS